MHCRILCSQKNTIWVFLQGPSEQVAHRLACFIVSHITAYHRRVGKTPYVFTIKRSKYECWESVKGRGLNILLGMNGQTFTMNKKGKLNIRRVLKEGV